MYQENVNVRIFNIIKDIKWYRYTHLDIIIIIIDMIYEI